MCLIGFNWQPQSSTPLILIANRDEFYRRPAQSLHQWEDQPNIFGGRDTEAGGTWLALTKSGRLAAVTNYREPSPAPAPLSRGAIPVDFLTSTESAEQFLDQLKPTAKNYAGFNALVFDGQELWHASNRLDAFAQRVEPGIHALSNHLLDTSWPKVVSLKTIMQDQAGKLDPQPYFEHMQNNQIAPDSQLPNTGVGQDMERFLSSTFIQSEGYGTRATTWVAIHEDGSIELIECSFSAHGKAGERTELQL